MTRILPGRQAPRRKAIAAGFSLLEVSVAMAVFLVVSATAFTLFSRHESLLGAEQGIAGLNIGLRNALSQIQIDVVNAGSGVIQGPQIPAWPVGVTIINSNPSSACNVTTTNPPQYTATCFDTLNVVMVDANTPPLSPSNSCSGASFDTTAGTPLVGTVPAVINPATGLNWTTAQVAARFVTGDQILFMSGTVTGTTYPYTTALLTAAGATNASPAGVKLTFTPTLAGGANNASNDPISMTTAAPAGDLTNLYCAQDFVLRLLPIQYTVSVTNTADPQLVRKQAGVTNAVMDQVIGFKVGAATWNNTLFISNFNYDYLASDYLNDFTLVRSVRVTIIGRTAPSTDPNYHYRNPFDLGAYQIRGSSIVVDPRNLTMGND